MNGKPICNVAQREVLCEANKKERCGGNADNCETFQFASKKNDDSDKSAEIKGCEDESQIEHEFEEGEQNDVSSEGEESEVESECGKISSPVSER